MQSGGKMVSSAALNPRRATILTESVISLAPPMA
jgi:hypothetical protein